MRLHLVVLAAGLSSRYGNKNENKLLAVLEGKPLYRHLLDRLIHIKDARDDVDDLTIVCQRGEIYDACRHDKRVFCVENRNPEEGIASSMKIGLTTVGCLIASEFRAFVHEKGQTTHTPLHDTHTMFCFVADEPYLQADTINAFFDGFKESGKKLGAVSLEGMPYNPCAFRNDCWQELSDLAGDIGGKQLIRRYADDVYYYPLAPERAREVADIDYKEDLP